MIQTLSPDVARKIAAGEVIDRPNAIVRELLDNAVDSGADKIVLEIEDGGIKRIRAVDNGCGMDKDDLQRCARPHTTSKIHTAEDLLSLTTLGFRGEALASIAAVSRLTITSGGWRMRASLTEDHLLEQVQPVQGTIVESRELFENFPARRQFLKRPASEMVLCRTTFIEKSLPRPDLAFRLSIDGTVRLDLPAGQTQTQRFVQAAGFPERESFFNELNGKGSDFSFKLVIGEPTVSRNDKKHIYIFINGRRITDYALTQAIEYGCQGYFPNGTHPAAALFVSIDPSKVDFNIHPAKREVRFQDISELHHQVSTTVRNYFHNYTVKAVADIAAETQPLLERAEPLTISQEQDRYNAAASPDIPASDAGFSRFSASDSDTTGGTDLRSRFFSPSSAPRPAAEYPGYKITRTPAATAPLSSLVSQAAQTASSGFRYIGTALGTFLLAEKNNVLYIIDQHAAHERILYDRIMSSQGHRQKLLVPYIIETESAADDAYLESIAQELDEIGFSSENRGNGRWEFTSVPERWKGSELDLSRGLLDNRLEPGSIMSVLSAMTACKAAVKDGDVLDAGTAEEIARKALELPEPHCPHGRPVFTAISREQLFALVKRT